MKTIPSHNRSNFRHFALLTALMAMAALNARAADYYWDANGSTAGTGGTGTWTTANTWRLSSDTGTLGNWPNAGNHNAFFAGTAGAVTVGSTAVTLGTGTANFSVTGYTLQTDAQTTARTVTGNLSIGTGITLSLLGAAETGSRTLNIAGNISGGTVAIVGAQSGTSSGRVNMSAANTTLSSALILSNSSTGNSCLAATATGIQVTGAINLTNGVGSIGATSGNDITLSSTAIISGPGTLMFAAGSSGGTGTITINSQSTYGGSTIFNAGNSGVVNLGTNNALSTNAAQMAFSAGNGGILDLKGFNQTFSSLSSGAGGGIIRNTGTGTSTLTINGSSSTTFGLVISNAIALSKSGSGTLTLTGANLYTGDTTISGGTLALSGSGSIASSAVIAVGSGGTFDVSGVASALALGTNQALRVSATGANTTATLTVASTKDLTLGNTGGLAFTAYGGGSTAPLTVSGASAGALALNSAPVTVTTTAALGEGTYKLVAKGGGATGVSGTPGTLTINGSGISSGTAGTLSVTSGELILTVSGAPSSQATSFASSNITSSGATVGWARGNGTAGVLVLARAGGAVNADPSNGTDYTANAIFGNGSQIGTGNFVVYKGTGTSVNVTGLAANTAYHFAIYEYNTAGTIYNLTELTGNLTSASAAGTLSTDTGSLSALTATTYGVASSSASFSVTGSNLNNSGVTVTPPAGFEVSTTSDFASVGTSSSALSLGTSDSLSTTIYVRLAATTVPGSYSGNISVAGGGASAQSVSIAASTVNTKALTIASAAVMTKTYDGTTAATITGNLSGIVGSDVVNFSGTGTFNSANAGSNIPVTSTSTLGGANAGYYTLTQPTGLSGTINKADQTITFAALANRSEGGANFSLTAIASSGLTVSYTSSNPGVATVSGSTVTIVGQGTTTITASQAGDTNYNAAPNNQQNLTIDPPPTTLAAGDVAIIGYNAAGNPDTITLLFLKTLNPATTFYVSDNEVDTVGGSVWKDTGEAEATFTVSGGQTIPAGTVLILPWGNQTVTDSRFTWTGHTNAALGQTSSNFDDGVYIYTGTSPTANPTAFIYYLQGGSTVATAGNIPAGLSFDSTALSFTAAASRYKLTGATYGATAAQLLAAIDTASNWEATAPASATDWTFNVYQTQTISFTAIPAKTYGDSSFALSATASSGLAVTLTSQNTNVATVAGNTVTIVGAGSANIVASQAGGTTNGITYVAATPVTNSLTVNTRPIEVTADPKSKTYGATNPALTFSVTSNSLVGSDTLAGALATTATTSSAVGGSPYAITQGTLTSSNNPNYTISFITNGLTVNAKDLTVTANNASKVQGVTLTGGAGSTAFTSSGLVSGDVIDSVTITYTSGGGSAAAAGDYPGAVVPSAATGTSFVAGNYNITYVAGDLTVTSSPEISVSGTLGARSTTYGTASAAASFTVSGGFLSGDLTVTAPAGFEVSTTSGSGYAGSLNLSPSSGTVNSTTIYVRLAASTAVGTYSGNVSVTGGGATAQNVAIGSSTVATKALTITGLSGTDRDYDGTTAATFSGSPSYSGLVNGESYSVLGTPTASFANKAAGTNRVVTITGYTAPTANYSLTDPATTATIRTKALTVTEAAVTTKNYDGNTGAVITGTLSGVETGDTVTLNGTGTFASATPGSGIAVTSTSTLGGADAGNYSLTQPTGLTGTINKASNTITFGALANRNVGDAAFNLSATASSGLTVSYSSSDSSVASVSGNTVTILKAGKVTITASQAGDSIYAAATPVEQPLFILGPGSILFTGINTSNPDQFSFMAMHDLPGSLAITFTDNAWSGSALGTSEGTIVYTTPAGGLAAGSRVVIQSSGSGSLVVGTSGSGIVSGSGSVAAPSASFSLNSSGDNVFAYTGTSTSPNFLAGVLTGVALTSGSTSASLTYIPSVISGATVQVVATSTIANSQYTGSTTGVASLLASALLDRANWGNSSTALTLSTGGFTFIGSQLSQTISFAALDGKTYGDAVFGLSASADSGLPISYTSSDTNVATVSGTNVTIRKAGSTTIQASQAGNPQYSAASPVSQTLTVAAKSITGSFTASNKVYDGTAAATVATRTVSGKVGSDDVNHTGGTASFDNANAGTTKTVTLTGATLTGAAAGNYVLASVSTATADITAASLPAVTWSNGLMASSGGVASFSLAHSGRSNNTINTVYSSSNAPTAPGFYTVVATSTDGNYSGSTTNNYFVAGPVLADDSGANSFDLRKPQNNGQFYIDKTAVLANDKRIDADGNVQTTILDIAAVTAVTGSVVFTDPWIIYTPTSAATDSFTYTVTVDGVSATATVTVTPETNADLPTFSLQIVSLGTATFTNGNTVVSHDFIGVPNKSYALEYSTNLSSSNNWIPAGSVNTGGTGSFTATLTATNTNVVSQWNSSMFFRAKVNP